MRSDERDSVTSGGTASTLMFSAPDISMQVEQLEKRIAQQACKDLTLAAASGKTSDVTRAIELGAEVDTTVNGYTPLMRAANWGHVDTLAALIAEGGDMFATDRQGRTALDWSRIARHDKAARVLERAMENEIRYRREASKAVRGKRELWAVVQANARHTRDVAKAIDARDLREIKRIVDRAKLSRHEFLSACNRLGFRNAAEAHRRVSKSDHGSRNNGVGNWLESHQAGPGSSTDPIKEVVHLAVIAAPPTAKLGGTQAAAGENEFGDSNTSPSATPENGALVLGALPVFFLDAEGKGGTTALALATVENDGEMVRRLVKEGADPGVEASTGHTALTWAATCGFDLIAAELLLGGNSNGTSGNGGSSRDTAGAGSTDSVIDAITRSTVAEGKTALHSAAFNGNAGVVILLLDRLRDLLLTDGFSRQRKIGDESGPGKGWFHPFRDFVRRTDHQGSTAWDLARQGGYDEVGILLDNAEGRIEVWEAGESAVEYALQRVECGNDGCRHRDRRDRIERHERTECPRRPAGCPACGKKLAAEDLQQHDENECDKRSDACPNAFLGCFDVMPHERIASHVAHTCKFRRVDCRRGCGASVVAHQLDVHEQEHCRLSKHPCVFGCGEKITKAEMSAHIKKNCVKRKIRCRVGCGSSIEAGGLRHHEEEVCTQPCCWEGCGERLGPALRRAVHEKSLCPERPAECIHGCRVRGLTAALKDTHALHHCQLRPVPCPHGCGAYIPNIELPAHVRGEGGTCPERLQRCRLDCLHRKILVAITDDCESTARSTTAEVTTLATKRGGVDDNSDAGDDNHSAEKRERGEGGEKEDTEEKRGGGAVQLVPGMLKSYDKSTGLFGIRYSFGNRRQALKDLDFVWADQGGDSSAWMCGWVPAASMSDHLVHSCPLRSAPCRDGCGQSLVVQQADHHYQEHCPKRFVLCPYGCRVEVRQENLGKHMDDVCPLRRLPCEACGVPLPLDSHPKHLAESCVRVPRRCPNGCGTHIQGEDLQHHLSTECPKRVVPCPLGCPEEQLWAEEVTSHVRDSCPLQLAPCRKGCGKHVAVCSREKHEANECSERVVTCECGTEHTFSETEDHRITACLAVVCYCSLGCGVKVRKMDMDLHQEEQCERKTLRNLSKMIECPLGCGHLILRQWEFQHRTFDCPKRPARCPGGCSADVTADEAATHFMTCGRRRIRCGAESTGCERMLMTWVGHTEASLKGRRSENIPAPGNGGASDFQKEGEEGLVACSDHGSDAMMWAAGKGDPELLLLEELILLSRSASIDRESHHGDTALTIACSRGHVETVRTLVKAGHANINHETRAGKTPLIEAARHGRTAVVRLLMELRAVIPYKNRRGQTAAWWAKRLGHQDCVLPMMREIKAEATLRRMSSQIARGDVNAVRSLVELGEPYRNNHCEHLESQIVQVTKEFEAAAKELRDLTALKDQLGPGLERLKASLAADLAKRRKIQREAARSARAGGGGRTRQASTRGPVPGAAAVSSRSFQAMQSRALRLFQRSVSRLQVLTDEDFKRVAGLDLLHPGTTGRDTVEEGDNHGGNFESSHQAASASRRTAKGKALPRKGEEPASGSGEDDASDECKKESKDQDSLEAKDEEEEEEDESNPTPSLSARSASSSSSHRRRRSSLNERPDEGKERGGQLNHLASLSPSSHPISDAEAAAVLRVLRATVIVLGGCGLGALPSDKELWEAVKPMLLDGSLKQRVRHFDRRRVPNGILDGVRALLNMGVSDDDDDVEEDSGTCGPGDGRFIVGQPVTNSPTPNLQRAVRCSTGEFCYAGDTSERDVAALEVEGREDEESTIATAATTIDGNRAACDGGATLEIPPISNDSESSNGDDSGKTKSKSSAIRSNPDVQSNASTSTDGEAGHTDNGDSDQDDGPDPWGDGRGESRWGQRILVAERDGGGGGGGGGALALVEALGAWCASVSAYDRLVHLAPGSAARKAAEAETEWDELERRIARSALNVQLEEFSLQVLCEEIEKSTTSADYLSQKRSWSEDRLGVARLMSLFSPAGHSLLSWAAACGQTEVVEILMDHGATAEPGDETRAVSASIIQAFYRFRKYVWRASPHPEVESAEASTSSTIQRRGQNARILDCGSSDDGGQVAASSAGGAETGGRAARQAEERRAFMRRRMEYMIGMVGRQATLARLRKSRRLPLTEAAYNGHFEVLQYFRLRRAPLYGASRTWLYPSAPPPFAPLGDGTTANYVLETPMSVADCAEAGTRDRGCKQRIPGRGWVGETDGENRFAVTERIAGAVWREITTVAAMGREEKGRRRALRVKMRKQETLLRSMDTAIGDGYLRAPDIVALCQEGASIDRETESGKTALITAAEEDPQALGHEWVKNEEGWEVLAAALLLDRRIHRPKIDYESRVTGHTALTKACVLGRLETAEVLIDRGADINRLPKRRPLTPLQPRPHQKPRQQSPTPGRPSSPSPAAITPAPASRMAITGAAAGGVTGVRERFCQTPLVTAAAAGHAAMVKLLLERGADPEVRDGNGATAADVAKRGAFVDVLGELARREAGNLGVAAGERGAANPLVPCGWGCGKLVATGHQKTEHEQECAHREVECKYACGAYRLQQRQLERHLAESCRLRPVVCSTRCGVSVVAEDYANHQATSCAMRPVVCKACKNKVVASALSRHEAETCPMRMVECEQGCGEEVPVSGLAHHLRKTCPLMSVKCRLGCGLTMQLKMLTEHERSMCSERLVECRWRCLKDVKARHIDEHEKLECSRADAPCGNRCGLYVPLGDMKRHYADSCTHRFVPCGLGCGYRVRAKDLLHHERTECEARLVSCPSGCTVAGNGDGGGEQKSGGGGTAIGTVALFPARAVDVHLKFGCSFRLVKCAACGDKVKAIELDAHKKNTCRRRPVACRSKGCFLNLPAEDMAVHEQSECARRRVWCLQGCGDEMRADERRRHHTTACSMRYLLCPLGCPKKVRASEADDHADFFCVRRHLA